MDTVLLKESHENYYLREGYLLALQFSQGWACFRITGWEPSNVRPYSLGAVAAASNLASWNEIQDGSNRRYLDPPEEYWLNHVFWGINKPKARVFFQYPTRQDRWSLTAVQRAITGDVGYVDGEMSPFDGPFSVKTQMFAVHELYPAFQVYNPLPDAMDNVMMSFDVMRYSYALIKDKDLISEILTAKRTARLYTMGGIDPSPARMPDWLYQQLGGDLVSWSKQTIGGGS